MKTTDCKLLHDIKLVKISLGLLGYYCFKYVIAAVTLKGTKCHFLLLFL